MYWVSLFTISILRSLTFLSSYLSTLVVIFCPISQSQPMSLNWFPFLEAIIVISYYPFLLYCYLLHIIAILTKDTKHRICSALKLYFTYAEHLMSILNLLMSHPKFIGPNKFFPVLSNDINPLRAHVKNILFSSNYILMNIKCCIICLVNMSYIYP